MPTLMQRGLSMASRASAATAGGTIVYIRGDMRVTIDATFGQTEYSVDTSDSVRLEHTDRDFIFAASKLILGGTLATPARGDRVEDLASGEMFEVLPIDGKQCYRKGDPMGVMIRVYGKLLQA